MINQEDILYGKIGVAGKAVPIPTPVGVNSFNTRQGDVLPQTGDYTSGMTNSVDISSVITNEDIENLFN